MQLKLEAHSPKVSYGHVRLTSSPISALCVHGVAHEPEPSWQGHRRLLLTLWECSSLTCMYNREDRVSECTRLSLQLPCLGGEGMGLQTSQWDSFQVSASKGIEPKEYKWEVGRSGASRRRAVVHGDCDISCKMWAGVPLLLLIQRDRHFSHHRYFPNYLKRKGLEG